MTGDDISVADTTEKKHTHVQEKRLFQKAYDSRYIKSVCFGLLILDHASSRTVSLYLQLSEFDVFFYSPLNMSFNIFWSISDNFSLCN